MSKADLIQVEEAIRIATSFSRFVERSEYVPLAFSVERRLYHDLHARIDLPPFDQSAMDGWALSLSGLSETYAKRVAGDGQPGHIPGSIDPGQATRISTGARVPVGADRVVLQECAYQQDDRIVLKKPIASGANIRLKGEDVHRGQRLLPKGAKLDARKIALLASQGMPTVEVQAQPRVVVISSGSELRQPGEPPNAFSVYDCNRPMLMALAEQAGGHAVDGGVCVEDPEDVARLILKLSEDADLVVLTGGSSIGEKDVTSAGLALAGAALRELKIAMKPGKPAVVGKVGETSILGLPGNPLAAFVSWFILGRSMMSVMHGSASAVLQGRSLEVSNDLRRTIGKAEFVPARLIRKGQQELVEFLGRGSGRLLPLSHADGLACIDAARDSVLVGDYVMFLEFE